MLYEKNYPQTCQLFDESQFNLADYLKDDEE